MNSYVIVLRINSSNGFFLQWQKHDANTELEAIQKAQDANAKKNYEIICSRFLRALE